MRFISGILLQSLIAWTICLSLPVSASVTAMEAMLNEARRALTHPESIPATAQRIQDYLSDPQHKSQIGSEQGLELARIQTRLVNYIRLSVELNHPACNIDKTQRSKRSSEVLSGTLTSPLCQSWEVGFFQQHQNLSALIEDIKLIEERSYKGSYAVDEQGDLVFPWQKGQDQKDQYQWKHSLPTVQISNDSDSTQAAPGNEFRDELYKQSLKDTFKTFMHLHTSYGQEKIHPEKLAEKFCKEKESFFSKLTKKKKTAVCPNAVKQYVQQLAKESIKDARPVSYEGASQELNTKINQLNKISEEIKNNTTPKYDQTSLARTGQKIVVGASFKDVKEARKSYEKYQKLHAEISSSGTGIFTATSELQAKLGVKPFDPLVFQKSHPQINPKEFKQAVAEAQTHTFNHAQELLSLYHSDLTTNEQIESFLKLNPAAASQVLINRPEFGRLACQGLKGISVDEMNDHQLRLVTTWGGAIVGGALAFTGLGAIPMAVAGAAVGTPELALSYKHFQQASIERNAGFAEQNAEKAVKSLERYQEARTELVVGGAFTGAGILADVYQGLRAGRAATSLSQDLALSNNAVSSELVEKFNLAHADEVEDLLKSSKQLDLTSALTQLKKHPEHFLVDGVSDPNIFKLELLNPGSAKARYQRKLNWKYNGSKLNYLVPEFKPGSVVTEKEIIIRDALNESSKVLDTPELVHHHMQNFETEVMIEVLKKHPDYRQLNKNKQLAARQEAMEKILAAEEIKHDFKSAGMFNYQPLILERKGYSLNDWFEMLKKGHAFNDSGFLPSSTQSFAKALEDTTQRNGHGYYTHRIQIYVLMKEMDKDPSRFKNVKASEMIKMLGDMDFNKKMGRANSSQDTLWQLLFDRFDESYQSPEFFRQNHEDYPELGAWL
jgi:hypothetical protein